MSLDEMDVECGQISTTEGKVQNGDRKVDTFPKFADCCMRN